ncbi:hypothetical protein WJX84_001513 [Apatococcus fuscideae]|uniref:LrgB-like protein n=1 Tax=Apatococcus fuscideae TaxID=2026836 RepID=A0AAW1TE19_9CHLO
MEDAQVLLPKVAWPARGGKEIIYRASSPRDPDYLDKIDTEIDLATDGTGSQLPGGGGPGLHAPVTNSKKKDSSRSLQPFDVEEAPSTPRPSQSTINQWLHWGLSLGTLYLFNLALAKAVAAAGISFPSPLIGMFGIIGVLVATSAVSQPRAEQLCALFQPAVAWIEKWLALFYVPSLVMLPLSLRSLSGSEMARIMGVNVIGVFLTLLVTAQIAISVRNLVRTQLEETTPPKQSFPFNRNHYIGWGALLLTTFLGLAASGGSLLTQLSVPFLLASTVCGYLGGTSLPSKARAVFHPVIVTAACANIGALLQGWVTGIGYDESLRSYLTKTAGAWGAGDWLMSLLGVVILSFGFKIFGQRRLMKRHAPEIFGSVILSAAFSLLSTAFMCRAAGLSPAIARGTTPRSVTIALALPIATALDAPHTMTAFSVVLSGLIGANFSQLVLTKLGYKDPIARGLACAGSAHGLGTAALAASESEAVPFAALAYALMGITSTLLVALPPFRSLILMITG